MPDKSRPTLGRNKETWLFNVQTEKRIYYNPETKSTNEVRVGSICRV